MRDNREVMLTNLVTNFFNCSYMRNGASINGLLYQVKNNFVLKKNFSEEHLMDLCKEFKKFLYSKNSVELLYLYKRIADYLYKTTTYAETVTHHTIGVIDIEKIPYNGGMHFSLKSRSVYHVTFLADNNLVTLPVIWCNNDFLMDVEYNDIVCTESGIRGLVVFYEESGRNITDSIFFREERQSNVVERYTETTLDKISTIYALMNSNLQIDYPEESVKKFLDL